MKKMILGLLTVSGALCLAPAARASDVMVASAMQRCTTNEDCTLITNSCADNCGFVPVNKMNLGAVQGVYQSRCGKPMEANPQCNINPPIAAACINSRCTIDYAYANHAGAKDYKSGAYNAAEPAVASQVPASAAPANDRQGFSAYNMQNEPVRQNTLGEIRTTIYVPPSAPVSGGNYVPVAPRAGVAPYAPTAGTYATPPVVKPVAPTPQPRVIAPAPVVAPAKQPAPQPTATTTPTTNATPSNPIPSSAPNNLKEPRVPDAQPLAKAPNPATGNLDAPVPPSDFKEQKLVPPPGSTSEVAPEDPGAKPAGNVVLAPHVPRGPNDPAMEFTTKTNNSAKGTNQ